MLYIAQTQSHSQTNTTDTTNLSWTYDAHATLGDDDADIVAVMTWQLLQVWQVSPKYMETLIGCTDADIAVEFVTDIIATMSAACHRYARSITMPNVSEVSRKVSVKCATLSTSLSSEATSNVSFL